MIEQTVFQFFQNHYDFKSPLLLGLSGGPDSLALFHLLLKYRKQHPFELGIAHVDHGWRQESSEEARLLQNIVEKEGLPFHLKTLLPEDLQGNLEAASRDARILFFADLCQKYHYQAVLLAHHADDQAETVLKRVLEGASLPYLCGLRETATVHNVLFWRPLLKINKNEILQWLERHQLKGFDDRTNRDPRFLRGKFRTRILPALSKEFGKQVEKNLERLGAEALEWHHYLNSKVIICCKQLKKGNGAYFSI